MGRPSHLPSRRVAKFLSYFLGEFLGSVSRVWLGFVYPSNLFLLWKYLFNFHIRMRSLMDIFFWVGESYILLSIIMGQICLFSVLTVFVFQDYSQCFSVSIIVSFCHFCCIFILWYNSISSGIFITISPNYIL